jgi:hypothetical protein
MSTGYDEQAFARLTTERDSLRMELDAAKHNRIADNSYLLGENARLRKALEEADWAGSDAYNHIEHIDRSDAQYATRRLVQLAAVCDEALNPDLQGPYREIREKHIAALRLALAAGAST